MKHVNANPFLKEVEPEPLDVGGLMNELPPGELKHLAKYVEKDGNYLAKLVLVTYKMFIENRTLFHAASESVKPALGWKARRQYVYVRLRGKSRKKFAALMKEEKRLIDKLCPEYAWHRQNYWHENS